MYDFEIIDKVVKCKKFREAFVFDGVLSSAYNLQNKFGLGKPLCGVVRKVLIIGF